MINDNMLSMLGNLGNLGNLGALGSLGNLNGLFTGVKKENPMDLFGNISKIWTNEYYDVQEQEDLEDFLIKEDKDDKHEEDNEEDKDDEDEEVNEEIEDDIDIQQFDLSNLMGGLNKGQNERLSRYLGNFQREIAFETMILINKENVAKLRDLVEKISTQEQYDNLISVYETRLSGQEIKLKSPIGEPMIGVQEVRTKEDGTKYIWNQIKLSEDNIEYELDFELIQKIKDTLVMILNYIDTE